LGDKTAPSEGGDDLIESKARYYLDKFN